MAVTVDSLVPLARLESGLRDNAYYSSDQIISYLSNGGSELYDLFTAANQHYIVSQYDFTATGPASAIVSLPARFQQGHSLEIYPDLPGQARTIRFLPNWLNRNSYTGAAFPLIPGGGFDPVYTFLDNKLRFYPPQVVPAAPFRLYYTPLWTPLAAKITTTVAVQAADAVTNVSGNLAFVFASLLPLNDGMVGGTLTPTFGAPNTAFNGVYMVQSILGNQLVTTVPFVGGFSNPASGSVTIVYSPAGTTNVIPTVMEPWSEYLVIYAAIAINTDRQRGTGELERKLAAMKQRISSVIAVRQEEPQQPPLTRGVGWDGGSGGGWWP